MFASGVMAEMFIRGSNGETGLRGINRRKTGLLLPLDDYSRAEVPLYADRLTMNNVPTRCMARRYEMDTWRFRAEGITPPSIISSTLTWLTASAKKCPPRWTS
jgi:hypothetical protein